MRYAWLFIIINSFFYTLRSQNTEYFHLNQPNYKAHASLYNSVDFIDSREDTSDFGKVYSRTARRLLPAQPQIDFYTQFNWLLANFTDSTAKPNELLVQLRKFKFFEFGDGIYNCGYCTLRLDLYSRKENGYIKIARLDTVIYLEEVKNITTSLFDATSEAINDFVFIHLAKIPDSQPVLMRPEIMSIQKTEKQNMPLYNNTSYKNGVYFSYQSFKNQVPDFAIAGIYKNQGEIEKLFIVTKNQKIIKRNVNIAYAFVYEDKPYMIGDFGCYLMEKRDDGFYFAMKATVIADRTSMALAKGFGYVLGGRLGLAIGQNIAKNSAKGLFETKLDHVDGSFIVLKRID